MQPVQPCRPAAHPLAAAGQLRGALLASVPSTHPAMARPAPPACPPPLWPPAALEARAARDAALATLVAGAARGNTGDFEAFYDRTVGHARALARRIVPADDVDDALADAYLDAWRHADRFDPSRGSAVTWLLTLVHSRAIDLRRRRGPAGAVPVADADADADDGATPAERLWQVEAGQRLHAALSTLSAQERWVLGLAYFRDLAHGAIAETTGLPLGTVKSLLQRAHVKLRRQLGALT